MVRGSSGRSAESQRLETAGRISRYKKEVEAFKGRLEKYKTSKEQYEKELAEWKEKYGEYLQPASRFGQRARAGSKFIFAPKRKEVDPRTTKRLYELYKEEGEQLQQKGTTLQKEGAYLSGKHKALSTSYSQLKTKTAKLSRVSRGYTISKVDGREVWTTPEGYKYFTGKEGKLAAVEDPARGESRLATGADILAFSAMKAQYERGMSVAPELEKVETVKPIEAKEPTFLQRGVEYAGSVFQKPEQYLQKGLKYVDVGLEKAGVPEGYRTWQPYVKPYLLSFGSPVELGPSTFFTQRQKLLKSGVYVTSTTHQTIAKPTIAKPIPKIYAGSTIFRSRGTRFKSFLVGPQYPVSEPLTTGELVDVGLWVAPQTGPYRAKIFLGSFYGKALAGTSRTVRTEGWGAVPRKALTYTVEHPGEVALGTFLTGKAVLKGFKVVTEPPKIVPPKEGYYSTIKKVKYDKLVGGKAAKEVGFRIEPKGPGTIPIVQKKYLEYSILGKKITRVPIKTKLGAVTPVVRGTATIKEGGKVRIKARYKLEPYKERFIDPRTGKQVTKTLPKVKEPVYTSVEGYTYPRPAVKYEPLNIRFLTKKGYIIGEATPKPASFTTIKSIGEARVTTPPEEGFFIKLETQPLRAGKPIKKLTQSIVDMTKITPEGAISRGQLLKIRKGVPGLRQTETYLVESYAIQRKQLISKYLPYMKKTLAKSRLGKVKKGFTYIEVEKPAKLVRGKQPVRFLSELDVKRTTAIRKKIPLPKPELEAPSPVSPTKFTKPGKPYFRVEPTPELTPVEAEAITQAMGATISGVESQAATITKAVPSSVKTFEAPLITGAAPALKMTPATLPVGEVGVGVKPTSVLKPRVRVKTRLETRAATRMKPRVGLSLKPRLASELKPRLLTRTTPRLTTRVTTRMQQRMQQRMQTRSIVPPGGVPPTTPPTIPGLTVPPPGLGLKKSRRRKRAKRKLILAPRDFIYKPSIIGITKPPVKMKTPKRPFTGLEIRRVIKR